MYFYIALALFVSFGNCLGMNDSWSNTVKNYLHAQQDKACATTKPNIWKNWPLLGISYWGTAYQRPINQRPTALYESRRYWQEVTQLIRAAKAAGTTSRNIQVTAESCPTLYKKFNEICDACDIAKPRELYVYEPKYTTQNTGLTQISLPDTPPRPAGSNYCMQLTSNGFNLKDAAVDFAIASNCQLDKYQTFSFSPIPKLGAAACFLILQRFIPKRLNMSYLISNALIAMTAYNTYTTLSAMESMLYIFQANNAAVDLFQSSKGAELYFLNNQGLRDDVPALTKQQLLAVRYYAMKKGYPTL